MGQYDKLGNLLKDAIDSGDLDNERKIRQNSKAVYPSEENSETPRFLLNEIFFPKLGLIL